MPEALRRWSTGSRRLALLFLVVLVPSAATLIWLGAQLVEQDRRLWAGRDRTTPQRPPPGWRIGRDAFDPRFAHPAAWPGTLESRSRQRPRSGEHSVHRGRDSRVPPDRRPRSERV